MFLKQSGGLNILVPYYCCLSIPDWLSYLVREHVMYACILYYLFLELERQYGVMVEVL